MLASINGWAQSGTSANTINSVAASADSTSARALFSFNFYDLDNQAIKLDAYQGNPLIVNFWARWCPPCRVEIPELVALQARNTGVDIIGINIETDPAPVRDFARAYDVNYPVFLTRAAGIDLMRALGNSKAGLPFTVVLNKHGSIVTSRLGAITKQQLDAAVALALR
jgi:thiol-disulfide isomerase/thioredoxin